MAIINWKPKSKKGLFEGQELALHKDGLRLFKHEEII
jgi:hypothetical protein